MILKTTPRQLSATEMIVNMSATNTCATMASIYKKGVQAGETKATLWHWPTPPEPDEGMENEMDGFITHFNGDLSGNILLIFTPDGLKALFSSMPAGDYLRITNTIMFERSMMTETAHIIISSYINNLVANMGIHIQQGPPIYLHDKGVALWQLAMTESVHQARRALYFHTHFSDDSSLRLAHIFMVPAPHCWEPREEALHERN